MASIDDERGVLVLRIVYDGPPFSGKTTTLRTLSASLGVQVDTPEEEHGRTLFFDWADYIGGLYDGRRIHCQIVSVPGQRSLAARRDLLVESADALVFVFDSRPGALEENVDRLLELLSWARSQSPPLGVVVQANKQDSPEATSAELLRSRLAHAPVAMTETVATSGSGVRETFVLAVRLALDRVRALGQLGEGTSDAGVRGDLVAQMLSLGDAPSAVLGSAATPASPAPETRGEAAGAVEPASPRLGGGLAPADTDSTDSTADELPFVPDAHGPGGLIWPPVDGRLLLHEVASLPLDVQRSSDGGWSGSAPGWRLRSDTHAIYESLEEARAALIAWARRHASLQRLLSRGRALVAADAGKGRTRLWQLVRTHPALRDLLSDLGTDCSDEDAAAHLLRMGSLLMAGASEASAEAVPMPTTLWTVGPGADGRPTYVGLMAGPGREQHHEVSPSAVVERELEPIVRVLCRQRRGLARELAEAESGPEHERLLEAAREAHREWHGD